MSVLRTIRAIRAALQAAWCELVHPPPRRPYNGVSECPIMFKTEAVQVVSEEMQIKTRIGK